MSNSYFVLLIALISLGPAQARCTELQQWSVHEIVLQAEQDYENAYTDVEVTATFNGPENRILKVRGFWDGEQTFRVRFAPPASGPWEYSIDSQPADPGLVSSGRLDVGEPDSATHGFLRRDREFPTSFSFDDGSRFFMWGTTYYHLLANARAGDRWQAAIDGAQRYGMNKARFVLAGGGGTKKSGGYPETSPFSDAEKQVLDLEHWRAADRALRYMHARGFLADIILFWRMHETEVSPAKRQADERYLRYALARYAAYPHVIWCMVNEWNYSKVPRDYWNHLGRLVREEDPWGREGASLRAHSIHQQTRPDWNFADQDWPSHAIIQLGVRNRGESVRIGDEWKTPPEGTRKFIHGDDWGNHSIVRNWTGNYPIVNDEYGYIGEPFDDSAGGSKRANRVVPFTRDKHRRTMWSIAVGGGYAAAGDKNSYPDGSPYFSGNWHEVPEYGDIKHLIDFFTTREIEYWKMSPRNDLAKDGERVYVLADPGHCVIAYAAVGGKFSLELDEGHYDVTLFDPRTGEDRRLDEIEVSTASKSGNDRAIRKSAATNFAVPTGNDWLLRVSKSQ